MATGGWGGQAINNPFPFAHQMAANERARAEQDPFSNPMFQYNQGQNIQQQQEQNQRQHIFNQIARQQAEESAARLGLQKAQFQFDTQQTVSNLLQELLGNQVALALQQQSGIRNLSDLGIRTADTRFNVERQRLMDALRLNDINTQAAPARAARLIGR